MNWDIIEGNWMKIRGKVRERWGHLTDDPFDIIAGKRESLAGKIQISYGTSQDETDRQHADFEKRFKRIFQFK